MQALPGWLEKIPEVLNVPLSELGDSALNLELQAWSAKAVNRKGRPISAINFAIYDKFHEHGIEIPFPQQDLRTRGAGVEVNQV